MLEYIILFATGFIIGDLLAKIIQESFDAGNKSIGIKAIIVIILTITMAFYQGSKIDSLNTKLKQYENKQSNT